MESPTFAIVVLPESVPEMARLSALLFEPLPKTGFAVFMPDVGALPESSVHVVTIAPRRSAASAKAAAMKAVR